MTSTHIVIVLVVVWNFFHADNQIEGKVQKDDFEALLTSPTFVDKTLFLKTILENENCTLITAPPKFGKTSMVKMLKRFLEIEVNKDGSSVSNFSSDKCVSDTENYKLFKEQDLLINRFPDLFCDHFGKTPVIHVDFKLDREVVLESLYDAVKVFKEVIHRSFKQHEYLVYSERLTSDHVHYLQMWCEEHTYKTMIDTLYVSHGLQSLSQYLRTHFHGRRAFVVVDNYDHMLRSAMDQVKGVAEITKIVNYAGSVIRDVLEGNEVNVKGAFITGVSTIPFLNNTNFNDCFTYTFLGNHKYFEYFGFTKKDIMDLFSKSNVYYDPIRFDGYYGGYQNTKGETVYNVFSALEFLKTGLYGGHFTSSSFPKHLKDLLSAPAVDNALEGLLQNKTLAMETQTNTQLSDLVQLYKSSHASYSTNELPSLVLNNLLDYGFLTYDAQEESFLNDVVVMRNFVGVKIPNLEVREFLEKQLKTLNN